MGSCWHYLIAGGLMLVLLKVLGRFLSPSIFHTVVMIVCGALLYFIVLVIFRDSFFLENIRNVTIKIKQKFYRG